MLPILISLSLAPGSYFFCAQAGAAAKASPATMGNHSQLALCLMDSSLLGGRSADRSHHPADDQPRQSGSTRRHDVDHQNENDAIYRAGQAFGNLLGEVGHEQHEQPAHQRAGYGADAADHQPDEE